MNVIIPHKLKPLIRRVVEIDYQHKHRHLPGTLSALPIIFDIFRKMEPADTFILSKGHSCAALYAVLESRGLHPDVTKVHPERDPANGIEITAGSLGHGLPIAVGIAHGRNLRNRGGNVHVLMGDGECQEGTTWEALNLADRLNLRGRLFVYVDGNGYQGSERTLVECVPIMRQIFPISRYSGPKGFGVSMFQNNPGASTHTVTAEEFEAIMEELK